MATADISGVALVQVYILGFPEGDAKCVTNDYEMLYKIIGREKELTKPDDSRPKVTELSTPGGWIHLPRRRSQ